MESKILGGINIGQYLLTVVQTDEIFRIVQLILAILCSLVLLAYRIWKWYKMAKADNKITEEEIKQLIEENKDEVIKIIENIQEIKNDDKNNS